MRTRSWCRTLLLLFITSTVVSVPAEGVYAQGTFPSAGAVIINDDAGAAAPWRHQSGTFARPSVAHNPATGNQVPSGVPRVMGAAGKVGFLMEDSTQNLVADASFDSGTAIAAAGSKWLYVAGPNTGIGERVAKDTGQTNSGPASLSIVARGTSGIGAQQRLTSGWTAGSTVTLSGYIYVPVYASGQVNLDLLGMNSSNQVVLDTPGIWRRATTAGWVRFAETVTIPADTATLWVRAFADGAADLTAYFDDIQVEAKSYATSFTGTADDTTQAARAAETVTIPTAGVVSPAEGTVESWVFVDSRIRSQAQTGWPKLWGVMGGNALQWRNGLGLQLTPEGKWALYAISDGQGGNSAAANDTLSEGWHYFAGRWSANELALFIDGVKFAAVANPLLPAVMPSAFGVGVVQGETWIAGQANTLIGDVRVSSRARTDAEIASAYAASHVPGNRLTWDFGTTALIVPEELAATPWTYAGGGFSRASVAYNPATGNQETSGMPRLVESAGMTGFLVEPAVQNLVADASFGSGTDIAASSSPWKYVVGPNTSIGERVAKDTGQKYFGAASLNLVARGTLGIGVQQKLTNGWTPGSTVTLSGYIYVPEYTAGQVNLDLVGKNSSNQFVLDTAGIWQRAATAGWVRFTETVTIPADTTALWVRAFAGSATDLSAYIDGIQVEAKSYATSFIGANDDATRASRAADKVTIPTAGVVSPAEGTVESWVFVDSRIRSQAQTAWPKVWGVLGGDSSQWRNGLGLQLTPEGKWVLYAISDGQGSSSAAANDTLSEGWHYFAGRWSATELALFIDGVKVAAVANPRLPAAMPSAFSVGAAQGETAVSGQSNTLIGHVRVSSRARTDDDIAATHGSSRLTQGELVWDRDTTALVVPADVAIGSRTAVAAGQAVTVRLDLPALDPAWGNTSMRLSHDNSTWESWQPYVSPFLYILPAGDGLKTVYVQLQDAAGNLSPVYQGSITVQTAFPTGRVVVNDDAGIVGAWSYRANSFLRSSDAYSPEIGTHVVAGEPRVYTPWPSAREGFLIEGQTTNLLSANQASAETGLTGLQAWSANVSVPLATDQTRAGIGVASARVTATAAGNLAIRSDSQRIPVTSGTIYTFSAYAWAQTTAARDWVAIIYWYDQNGQYLSGQSSPLTPATGEWTRLSVTNTAPVGAASCYVELALLAAAAGESLWWDGAQLEAGYLTSWTPGGTTRAAETLTIPTAGLLSAAEGTVDGWVWEDGIATGQNRHLFTVRDAADTMNALVLWRDAGGYWSARTRDSSGTDSTATFGTRLSVGWHHLAMRWASNELALFVDGTQVSSVASPRMPSALGPVAFVGASGSSTGGVATTGWHNGLIGEWRTSTRARGSDDLAAAASASRLSWDIHTTARLVPRDLSLGTRALGAAAQAVTVRVDLPLQGAAAQVTEMRLSSDGIAWGVWQPYVTPVLYTLAAGDGPKSVYVQFRDAAGNVSPGYSARVEVVTAPPLGMLRPAAGSTAGAGGTLGLTVSHHQAVSWSGLEWKRAGDSVWQSVGTGGAVTPGVPFTVNWSVPTAPGAYDIRVKLADASGQSQNSETIWLTLPSAPVASARGGGIEWTAGGGTGFTLIRSADPAFPAGASDTLPVLTAATSWPYPFNGVTNGSFEQTASGGLPAHWAMSGTGTHAVDPANARWGSMGLKLSRTTAGQDGATQTVFTGPGLSGKSVTASGWLKADSVTGTIGAGAILTLQFLDRSGQLLARVSSTPVQVTADWQQVSVSGWAPESTWAVEVSVELFQASGTLWADGIQVEPSRLPTAVFTPEPTDQPAYYYQVTGWNGPLFSGSGTATGTVPPAFPENLGVWHSSTP